MSGSLRVMGMISGTSHDGVDVVITELSHDGDALGLRIVGGDSVEYPAKLRRRLVGLLPPAPVTIAEVCELDTLIGQHFAAVAAGAVERWGGVDLIASHGQTVYHWIEGGHCRGTLQIGQPAWIAEATGAPTWSDLRIRDITVGGHGAPLVPILDRLLIGDRPGVALLNLGGIANMSLIEAGDLIAYDLGPANALVDAVITERGLDDHGYDTDGRLAAAGHVDETLLARFLDEPYYRLPSPKSTGKELFHPGYVREGLQRHHTTVSDADLVATLTRLSAEVTATELRRHAVTSVIASGGGCANPTLMRMITDAAPGVRVGTTDELGIPADLKEAVAFAVIGWHSWHALPGAVITATGARADRVLGTLTPGASPLRLPDPMTTAPTRLEVLA